MEMESSSDFTERDLIACFALMGLLVNESLHSSAPSLVKHAYLLADAMLQQRTVENVP